MSAEFEVLLEELKQAAADSREIDLLRAEATQLAKRLDEIRRRLEEMRQNNKEVAP